MPVSVELPADWFTGDGKPQDVGTDRQIANVLNRYADDKSARNISFPFSLNYLGGVFAGEYRLFYIMPIFCGLEIGNTAITRSLSVAPRFASGDGTEVGVRITLSDRPPSLAPSQVNSNSQTSAVFTGRYAQATWTTTSTTKFVPDAQDLPLTARDWMWGFGYLCVELNSRQCICDGLAFVREGARVVV